MKGVAALLRGVLALFLLSGALGAEERLPGVPTVAQLVKMLEKSDNNDRIVKGFFRLLPKEDIPKLEAAWRAKHDVLTIEMVRRGFAPAVAFMAPTVQDPQNDRAAYFHELLDELTADELKPLAKAVFEMVKGKHQFNYGWIELAGKSGEPALLAEVFREFDFPGHESSLRELFRYGQSEAALAALRPYVTDGAKERRLRALTLLPRGWKTGPDAAWNVLLRDPDPAIRRAFMTSMYSSTSPAVLKLAEQAFADADANVAVAAASVVSTFKGADAGPTLQRLVLDKRLPAAVRERMWRAIAHQQQPVLIKEAQDLVLDRAQEKTLRTAAALHLGNQDLQGWLLTNLAKLEPEMQSALVTQMSASQSPEVLARIPPLLAKLDAKFGAPILRALGARRDPAVFEVLVNALKDTRPEIQAAAQDALVAATGLSPVPIATPQNKIDPKLAAGRWSVWYERFGKAPAPDVQRQIEQLTPLLQRGRGAALDSAGLGFDPFDALLRLGMDKQHGYAALRAFARLPDARVAPMLLELSDNELFSGRAGELSEVLAETAPSPPAIQHLVKKLDSADAAAKNFAVTLLIAWRHEAAAARLADEVLLKGAAFYNAVPKIVAWGHPAFAMKARAIVAAPKADAEARNRATQLLVHAGQPQDVLLLLQLAQDPKAPDASVLQVLIGLAYDGNAEAQKGVAGLIAGKDAGLRQAALRILADFATRRDSRVREVPETRVRELPEPIAAAVRAQLAVPNAETFPDVVAVLIGSGDESSLGVFASVLQKAETAQVTALVSAVTRSRSPAAARFILALIRSGKISGDEFSTLFASLRRTNTLSKGELDSINDEYKRAKATQDEAALGRADDGLAMQVAIKVREIPFDRKEEKAVTFPITVQNTGKTALTLGDHSTIDVRWRSAANPERTSLSLAQMYLGKSKPAAPGASFQASNNFELAPGKSVSGTLVVALPGHAPGGIPHQVSFQWRWSASSGSAAKTTKDVRGYYGTPWTELSLLPDLWLAIDARTQHGK